MLLQENDERQSGNSNSSSQWTVLHDPVAYYFPTTARPVVFYSLPNAYKLEALQNHLPHHVSAQYYWYSGGL